MTARLEMRGVRRSFGAMKALRGVERNTCRRRGNESQIKQKLENPYVVSYNSGSGRDCFFTLVALSLAA